MIQSENQTHQKCLFVKGDFSEWNWLSAVLLQLYLLNNFVNFQKSWLKSLALTAAQWMEKNISINSEKALPYNRSVREISSLDCGALAEDEKHLRETENLLETEWNHNSDNDKNNSVFNENHDDSESDFL